jgi:hypothetical protein
MKTTKTVQVTEKTFETTVERGIVLLDCLGEHGVAPAGRSPRSSTQRPARHPDVVFGKIDTESRAPAWPASLQHLARSRR